MIPTLPLLLAGPIKPESVIESSLCNLPNSGHSPIVGAHRLNKLLRQDDRMTLDVMCQSLGPIPLAVGKIARPIPLSLPAASKSACGPATASGEVVTGAQIPEDALRFGCVPAALHKPLWPGTTAKDSVCVPPKTNGFEHEVLFSSGWGAHAPRAPRVLGSAPTPTRPQFWADHSVTASRGSAIGGGADGTTPGRV